ncbi:MAG TPA: hypothetical protein VES42_17490, partial [Pilimelia sp.]|nr:hypothetical protein [Pilimelia sp.]
MSDATDWDDLDAVPEPTTHPAGPVVNGTVVGLEPGYTREVRVGQPVLAAVLAASTVARAVGGLLVSAVRAGPRAGGRPGWKGLRKGPDYLVTPLRLRDTRGLLCEVEIHGYVSRRALEPGDRLRARVRRQRDRALPPRVERIANLTTGQVLQPSAPTLWSHLGPALVLQALFGVALLAATAAA